MPLKSLQLTYLTCIACAYWWKQRLHVRSFWMRQAQNMPRITFGEWSWDPMPALSMPKVLAGKYILLAAVESGRLQFGRVGLSGS